MCELLIFGGTTEGRELAGFCCDNGIRTAVSVATEYGGELLPEKDTLRKLVGRLDCEQMKELIKKLGCMAVIDATHPYAAEVTKNIKRACDDTNMVCYRLLRSSSVMKDCTIVRDMDALVSELQRTDKRVLSTLGSKELPKLTELRNYAERIIPRVLPAEGVRELCCGLGFHEERLILEKGPFTVEQNIAHLKRSGAEILITKESGAAGGFPEKLEAAKQCGATVIVLARPEEKGSTMEEIKKIILEMRR